MAITSGELALAESGQEGAGQELLFQSLLAECAQLLLAAPLDDNSDGISTVLAAVAGFLRADHACVLRCVTRPDLLNLFVQWTASGVNESAATALPPDIPLPPVPELRQLLAHEGPVLLLRSGLPSPVPGSWRAFPCPPGARAGLAVPMCGPDGFIGMIAVFGYTDNAAWGMLALDRLRRVADLCAIELRNRMWHTAASRQLAVFAAAFRVIPEAIFISDGAGRCLHASDAAEVLTGFTREEILAPGFPDRYGWEHAADRAEFVRQLRQHGQLVRHRVGFRRKSGALRRIEISAARLPDISDGRIVTITRDVTAEERALAMLEETQAVAHIGGWDLNPETGLFHLTNEVYRMLRIPVGEPVTAARALRLYTQGYRRMMRRALQDALRYGVPVDAEGDMRVGGAKPELLRVRLQGRADMRDGRIVRLYGTMQDITLLYRAEDARRHYEQRLRQAAAELAFAEERERKRIAAELHDDVVQDLASLKLHMGQLAQTLPAGLSQELMQDSLRLLNRTINRSRALMYEISPPLLYELGMISAIEWLVEQLGSSGDIQCKFTADAATTEYRFPDDLAILVFQTVRELLTNIRKHAHASVVSVRCQFAANILALAISDNGVGMETERQSAPSRRGERFGLFNVRNRIDYFGGNVTIESLPGVGTSIRISLPVLQQPAGIPRGTSYG